MNTTRVAVTTRVVVLSCGCACACAVQAQAVSYDAPYGPVAAPTGLRMQFDDGTMENVYQIVGFWPSVHWLNSRNRGTSMAALGYTWRNLKLEGALFKERDANPYRSENSSEWLRIDSARRRLAYQIGPNWALQLSRGFLNSPDQFRQDQKTRRRTASLTYRGGFQGNPWHATLAYGRGKGVSGNDGNAYLLDTALRLGQEHTLFWRIERAGHDELFRHEDGPSNQSYQVSKMSVGYLFETKSAGAATLGIGGLLSRRTVPAELLPYYRGNDTDYTVFVRLQMKFN